jgi:uncharacterized protein YchJ
MTPATIDKDVKQLVMKVDPTHEPLYVHIKPEQGAEALDCFRVVEQKVKTAGGRIVYGWQVWKTPHLIEAECHAVWENPKGDLIDITPKQLPVTRILFLEDENVQYQGKQIDNIRLNISGNDLVDDLITVSEENFAFLNRGERADVHELSLNHEQKRHLDYIQMMQYMISAMLGQKATRNSPCFCGNMKKYSECHGENLLQKLREVQ